MLTLVPIWLIKSFRACWATSGGPAASNLRRPLEAVVIETLARDLRLMSLIISGIGRLSWPRCRTYCGSTVMDSTLRPGIEKAGFEPWGGAGEAAAGVDDREAVAEEPFAPLGALAPQMGATLALLPLPAPSSGKDSCD